MFLWFRLVLSNISFFFRLHYEICGVLVFTIEAKKGRGCHQALIKLKPECKKTIDH